MMDSLLELDMILFRILNGFGHPHLDTAMVWFSDKYIWIPLYAFIIYKIVEQCKSRFWIPIASIIVLIVLTDQFTSSLMKPFFERLRPCNEPSLNSTIILIKRCGGNYGFASSHAANTMGLAVFGYLFFDKKWIGKTLIIWSVLVGYSRIFLGVHYPGDVIAGFLIGGILSYLVYKMMIKYSPIS